MIDEFSDQEVGLQFDAKRILQLLGLTDRKADPIQVVLNEMVQNAADGIRSACAMRKMSEGSGTIDITLDLEQRRLTVADNGIGMSPDEVRNIFLCVGKSNKPGLDDTSAGGFGLAKLAFLFIGNHFTLTTTQDGIQSTLSATPNDLINGTARLQTQSADVQQPNGTSLTLILPDTYDSGSGLQPLDIHASSYFLLRKPLLGSFTVRLGVIKAGQEQPIMETLSHGNYFDYDKMPVMAVLRCSWGEVDIHISNKPSPFFRYGDVLCHGIPQFENQSFYGAYEDTPYELYYILNIKPQINAADGAYPIAKNRLNFSQAAKQDGSLEAMRAILGLLMNFQKGKKLAEHFSQIHLVNRVTNPPEFAHYDYIPFEIPPQNPQKQSQNYVSRNCVYNLTLKENGIYPSEGGAALFEATPAKTGQHNKVFCLTAANQADLNTSTKVHHLDCPVLHSNINCDLAAATALGMGVADTEVKQVIGELAWLTYDFLHQVMEIDSLRKTKTQHDPLLGLFIDKKSILGINTTTPFYAVLINPLAMPGKTAAGWAHGIVHAMMHEATHWHEGGHSERFTTALANLHVELEDAHPGLYGKTLKQLEEFALAHAPVLNAMREVLNDRTTKNVSNSLEGNSLTGQTSGSRSHTDSAPGTPHRGRTRPGWTERGPQPA